MGVDAGGEAERIGAGSGVGVEPGGSEVLVDGVGSEGRVGGRLMMSLRACMA